MNISPIGVQNVRQNNIQSKNPSFKKFSGIDKEFYKEFNSDELKVLLDEAEKFSKSKFCDIKYVSKPNAFYHVAINLKKSSILPDEPIKTLHEYFGTKESINIDNIGWKIIKNVLQRLESPNDLEFYDYDDNHYILPEVDEEIIQVYEDTCSQLQDMFSAYPNLKFECDLWDGLAFAHAYDAYWTRKESEAAKKNDLDRKFRKSMG